MQTAGQARIIILCSVCTYHDVDWLTIPTSLYRRGPCQCTSTVNALTDCEYYIARPFFSVFENGLISYKLT